MPQTDDFDFGNELAPLVEEMLESYRAEPRTRHIGRSHFPSLTHVAALIDPLLELLYPGYVGRQDLTDQTVAYHVGELLPRVGQLAYRQIYHCLCHEQQRQSNSQPQHTVCEQTARDTTRAFIRRLAPVREMLAADVQAALDGDPAARSADEIIIAYPGLLAISVYRLAHELYKLNVPLMPRAMTEWAHRKTGVDIHPGARIGRSFFIDHATGVVVGETTLIGDHVKLYQGVTLGALSFSKDQCGRLIREEKRHPTVEDHVTIYAGATVLGGDTVVGHHSQIGGSVFLTTSVPPYSTVTLSLPELKVQSHDRGAHSDGDKARRR